jgi:hypothetical protein
MTNYILENDLTAAGALGLTDPGQYSFHEKGFGCYIKTKATGTFAEDLVDGFLNISDMVDSIHVYESMFKTFVTAEMVIIDKYNIISKLEITGNEYVKIKFGTQGSKYPINMTLVVSKIKDKSELNPQFIKYTFSLVSEGFLKNQRTKISKSYKSSFSNMAEDIFIENFPSYDTLFIEKTEDTNNRLIIPNISPADAMNMISSFSVGENNDNASYLFFQTTKQYHFRSTASIIKEDREKPKFNPERAFTVNKEVSKLSPISEQMMNITEFKLLNDFDLLKSTSIGSLGSKLIEHDIYNKAIYTRYFQVLKDKYLDPNAPDENSNTDKEYINLNENYVYPHGSVDEDDSNLSSFTDSYINVVSSAREDQYADNIGEASKRTPYDQLPYDTTILNRNSELTSLMLLRAKIKIPGISGLQAGDVIKISKSIFVDLYHKPDEKMSGRWIIESISHQITTKYECILYIIRDSYDTKKEIGRYEFERIGEDPEERITPEDLVWSIK